jgi:dTDP-4-amino-4,6-dideoxygalactose transaminase
MDETKIEAAITSKTTGILATHVFGNPCAVEEITAIAKKHNLKVIYDAAHCFGVTYKGKSIFEYGDVSTCSFHATKLFHTGEGGALFTNDNELFNTLFYQHNFGHKGKEDFQGLGINAKMSELQAAMGLAVLPYIDNILGNRERVVTIYAEELQSLNQLKIREETLWNFAYFPVIFPTEAILLRVQAKLNELNIYPRRYFYPCLTSLPYIVEGDCPISEDISKRILCLPLYGDITKSDVLEICRIIKQTG